MESSGYELSVEDPSSGNPARREIFATMNTNAIGACFKGHSQFVRGSIPDALICLLYKIDAVLLGRNCRDGLKVTVEVALVAKSAFESSFRNIPALP